MSFYCRIGAWKRQQHLFCRNLSLLDWFLVPHTSVQNTRLRPIKRLNDPCIRAVDGYLSIQTKVGSSPCTWQKHSSFGSSSVKLKKNLARLRASVSLESLQNAVWRRVPHFPAQFSTAGRRGQRGDWTLASRVRKPSQVRILAKMWCPVAMPGVGVLLPTDAVLHTFGHLWWGPYAQPLGWWL